MADIESLNSLIRRWYARAKPGTFLVNDPFDNFVCLWLAFNAWGSYVTGIESNDSDMKNRLKTDPRLVDSFKKHRQDPEFNKKLLQMKSVKIPTHRTAPEYVCLNDEESFGEVLEVIYRIRCNLFHGRKDPEEQQERKYVEWAAFVLDHVFNGIMNRSSFLEKRATVENQMNKEPV
ncbi:hypothetical protein MUP07_03280 [Candidatus Bathyarchaeota archaeon]|nr:hypothetical protein [Candidatus Bathyarchaeota archaeon]